MMMMMMMMMMGLWAVKTLRHIRLPRSWDSSRLFGDRTLYMSWITFEDKTTQNLPISIRLVLQYQILRCENEEKWRKIWEEEREEIRKAEAEAQARMDAELLKASQKDAAQSRPGSIAGSRGSQGSRPQTSSSKSRPSAKWMVVNQWSKQAKWLVWRWGHVPVCWDTSSKIL